MPAPLRSARIYRPVLVALPCAAAADLCISAPTHFPPNKRCAGQCSSLAAASCPTCCVLGGLSCVGLPPARPPMPASACVCVRSSARVHPRGHARARVLAVRASMCVVGRVTLCCDDAAHLRLRMCAHLVGLGCCASRVARRILPPSSSALSRARSSSSTTRNRQLARLRRATAPSEPPAQQVLAHAAKRRARRDRALVHASDAAVGTHCRRPLRRHAARAIPAIGMLRRRAPLPVFCLRRYASALRRAALAGGYC